MKSIIVILFTVLLTSCNAQKIKTMKKFDIETFNKNKNELNEYSFYTEDSTYIEQSELKEVFTESIKEKDNYFERKNQYYKNGVLKITGLYFNYSFQKGIWEEYDKTGSLKKEIDHDKGFDYTWEDLLKLLKKRKVDIKHRYTTIRKDEGEWWVYYVEGLYIYNIRINGKTGKITLDDKDLFEEGS